MKKSICFTAVVCLSFFILIANLRLAHADGKGNDIMKFELKNGLSVVLKENHQAKVVAFQMWVRVGSADETDEISGISHVYEHMLFKGTKKRGVGQIAGEVEAAGGDINAFTSLDQTVYHITMASEFFDTGLDIIADAIQFSSFDPVELEKEQEVIVEEIKRGLDMPGRKLNNKFFKTAYQVHSYRRPVIGTPETVRSLTRDKILQYFRQWYRPNNMTLVIVGDFDTDDALSKIKELYKDFKPGEIAKPDRPKEPEQKEFRFSLIKDDVSEIHMNFGYHIPSVRDKDNFALDVMSLLVGQGESSRLYANIKAKKSLAHSIYAYAFTPKEPGILMIGTMFNQENTNALTTETIKEMERLKYELVDEEEIDKAKLILESDFIYEKETVQGQARKLGYFSTSLNDHLYEEKYLKGIQAVTAQDIIRVANKYIDITNLSVTMLAPEKAKNVPDKAKLLELVTSGANMAKEQYASDTGSGYDTTGEVNRIVIDNGITILVKENHANPTVALRTIFLGGVRYEDESNFGINNFISGMLTKGTKKRSAAQIVKEIESMAASLDGYSGKNSIGVAGEFLTKYLYKAFEITADMTLNPLFGEEEVEKRKKHVIASIKRQEDELTSLVFNLFRDTLYKKSPYRFNTLGKKENVEAFTSEGLARYYHSVAAPENLVISVVGDVNTAEIVALVKKYFGGMEKGKFKAPEVPLETPPEKIRKAVINKDKEQIHVALGFLGVTVRDDDRIALEVLSTILSRQGGRLFIELRDKQSLAYSVTSFSQEGYDPGFFLVYIASSPEKKEQAIEGILKELEKVVNEKIPEDELDMAKNYLIGNHEINMQRNSAQAANIGFNEIYGLGYDAYKKYAERIHAVTPEDAARVAKKYIKLDSYTLAIVGKVDAAGDE